MIGKAKVCVLFDADNVAASHAEAILRHTAGLGNVAIKRLYGNGGTTSNWSKMAAQHNIKLMQQCQLANKKNGADIALTVDAMDLLHREGPDVFCLISSDSDFTALASRLREGGCEVVVYGADQTPQSLIAAASTFVRLGELQPESSSSPAAAKKLKVVAGSKGKAVPQDTSERTGWDTAEKLIRSAYQALGAPGDCLLTVLASRLIRDNPGITTKSLAQKCDCRNFRALLESLKLFRVSGKSGSERISPIGKLERCTTKGLSLVAHKQYSRKHKTAGRERIEECACTA